jgi:hypothetical protein
VNLELFLEVPIGVLGDASLGLEVVDLLLEVDGEACTGKTGPAFLELGAHLVVARLFLLEHLAHLGEHVEIVIADGSQSLDHSLHIRMAALLLEVYDLLPESRRDLGGRGGRVEGLRKSVGLQELFILDLTLLFELEMLVDDFLNLLFDLSLHDTHLRRYDVAQLLLNRQLSSDVV